MSRRKVRAKAGRTALLKSLADARREATYPRRSQRSALVLLSKKTNLMGEGLLRVGLPSIRHRPMKRSVHQMSLSSLKAPP